MTEPTRTTMNGKPVITIHAKGIINFTSGFAKKLLCDGPTFSTGTACAYSCSFCYVPAAMHKLTHGLLKFENAKHEDVVIRREGALDVLKSQLLDAKGRLRFPDPCDTRVIYASPLVDVAANMALVRETVEACRIILQLTHWQIRLLSKSNLLPQVAKSLEYIDGAKGRMIFGVSTGTLDDRLAAAFEEGCALVSKRVESLHRLQDEGWRTYAMVCPSLPQRSYREFGLWMAEALRYERCEHVWAEVINVRGESMTRTVACLRAAGFEWEADQVRLVSENKEAWEIYARSTFLAHQDVCPPDKLRFLQYSTKANVDFWAPMDPAGVRQPAAGAVLL